MQAVLVLEFLHVDAQIAAAIGRQMAAGVDIFLAVTKAGAEYPSNPFVPGQLHKGLGIGNSDQLGRFGAVADIIAMTVDIEVGGRAID